VNLMMLAVDSRLINGMTEEKGPGVRDLKSAFVRAKPVSS
jgi:hypothetical protein